MEIPLEAPVGDECVLPAGLHPGLGAAVVDMHAFAANSYLGFEIPHHRLARIPYSDASRSIALAVFETQSLHGRELLLEVGEALGFGASAAVRNQGQKETADILLHARMHKRSRPKGQSDGEPPPFVRQRPHAR